MATVSENVMHLKHRRHVVGIAYFRLVFDL